MTDLRTRYIEWEMNRTALAERDCGPDIPRASEWHGSDDDAVELLREAMIELERRDCRADMGEITLHLPRFDFDLDNGDRAAMVAPLIEAFAKTYYHGSEMIDVVVSDFLGDLMHFWDRTYMVGLEHIGTVDDYTEDAPLPEFDEVVNNAAYHYQAEVSEEAEEAAWRQAEDEMENE